VSAAWKITRDRIPPIISSILFIFSGVTFSLNWGSLWNKWMYANGQGHSWTVPGDFQGIAQFSTNIVNGHLSWLYQQHNNYTGVVAPPGFGLLFAPVAWLASLSGPLRWGGPHPPHWPLLLSGLVLYSLPVLFALDNLARRHQVPPARRVTLSIIEAALLFPTVLVWGHPEDAVGFALAIWGYIRLQDERPRSAGWLWGAAIACQPLVILMLPVSIIRIPWRKWHQVIVRAAIPAVALYTVALIANFKTTWFTLLNQPSNSVLNHQTPWMALGRNLGHAYYFRYRVPGILPLGAKPYAYYPEYSVGTPRLLALAAAIAIAYVAYKQHWEPQMLLWGAGACLAARVFFEADMVPYYVWPALAILTIMAARKSVNRLLLVGFIDLAVCIYSYHRFSPWPYWLGVNAFMLLAVAVSFPGEWISKRIPSSPADAAAAFGGGHDDLPSAGGSMAR